MNMFCPPASRFDIHKEGCKVGDSAPGQPTVKGYPAWLQQIPFRVLMNLLTTCFLSPRPSQY